MTTATQWDYATHEHALDIRCELRREIAKRDEEGVGMWAQLCEERDAALGAAEDRDAIIETQRVMIENLAAGLMLMPSEGKIQASTINDDTHIAFTAGYITWRTTVPTNDDGVDEAVDNAGLYTRTSEALCAMDDAANYLEQALQVYATFIPAHCVGLIKRAYDELVHAGARQIIGLAVGPITGFGGVAVGSDFPLTTLAACRGGGAA